jgi:UDP-3-O-[3-hydroxymyristoyl] glucosamine N-acyltransferase
MKLRDLAGKLSCTLIGNADLDITGVAGIENAGPNHLTFLSNKKYAPKAKRTAAGAILVEEPMPNLDISFLVSANPYLDFARALECFYQPPRPAANIHPTAVITPTAKIGENCSIGAYAVIGEHVTIGTNAVIHPHVVIYDHVEIGDDFLAHAHSIVREFCRIGNRVVLQNGVVIGGDGYGFAKRKDGSHYKIVQSGITVLEDDVEVQTNTSIDRASIGETRVKRGAKIDSLVQIGHGCVVGEDNIICSQVGLAGSTILEKNVLLAGQVGVSGHLTIHDNVVVYAQSGVGHETPAGSIISGSPAYDARQWLRTITALPKFPDLIKAVRELERKMEALSKPASDQPHETD